MLGGLCKGFLSVLHCEGCLLCLSARGLNVCPSTLCIDSSCQLLHCSLVNICVELYLFFSSLCPHVFSTSSLPYLEWTDERINLCIHITVWGVCMCVFFHLCGVSRCCVCLLWHSQQSAFSGRHRQSVITLYTAVRDCLMEGIKQQYMKHLHVTSLSPCIC